MISSIIDIVLLSALAGTSGSVLLMYRRLQRFDALQGQAAKEFARTSDSIDKARAAIAALQADGGEITVTLASRLNEARMVINDIEQVTAEGGAVLASRSRPDVGTRHARHAPADSANRSEADAGTAPERVSREETGLPRDDVPQGSGNSEKNTERPDAMDGHGSSAFVRAQAVIDQPSAVHRIRAAARAGTNAGVAGDEQPSGRVPEGNPAAQAGPEADERQIPGVPRGFTHSEPPGATVGDAASPRWAPLKNTANTRWTPHRSQSFQRTESRWAAAAQSKAGHIGPAVRTVNWSQMARQAERSG